MRPAGRDSPRSGMAASGNAGPEVSVCGLAGSPFPPRELAAWLRAMLDGRACSVQLALLRDADMARLNERMFGLPGPTNILSFPAGDGGGDNLGELYLSLDALEREAFLYGQDPAEYARRLLAHGLAHLLGFGHGPAMEARETLLLGNCLSPCFTLRQATGDSSPPESLPESR